MPRLFGLCSEIKGISGILDRMKGNPFADHRRYSFSRDSTMIRCRYLKYESLYYIDIYIVYINLLPYDSKKINSEGPYKRLLFFKLRNAILDISKLNCS